MISNLNIAETLSTGPDAAACIKGGKSNPDIKGEVKLYQTCHGVLVKAEFHSLPLRSENNKNPIFAFHIHGGTCCRDCGNEPFPDSGTHFDKGKHTHPYHAGDMPPLLGNQGYAWMSFYDKRFRIEDIIGTSVVIHDMRDDFTSQPSGASGTKIGCGVIHASLASR